MISNKSTYHLHNKQWTPIHTCTSTLYMSIHMHSCTRIYTVCMYHTLALMGSWPYQVNQHNVVILRFKPCPQALLHAHASDKPINLCNIRRGSYMNMYVYAYCMLHRLIIAHMEPGNEATSHNQYVDILNNKEVWLTHLLQHSGVHHLSHLLVQFRHLCRIHILTHITT